MNSWFIPLHGVGQILASEDQEIAGAKLELFVINFMKDRWTAGADRRSPMSACASCRIRRWVKRRSRR